MYFYTCVCVSIYKLVGNENNFSFNCLWDTDSMAQWVTYHFISINILIPAPTEDKWDSRTKSTLSPLKKLHKSWKKKKRKVQIQSLKGNKKKVKVLIDEESFSLKRAILDYPSVSCGRPELLFKDSQWLALPLQSVCLFSGLLTTKMLGAAQLRCSGVAQPNRPAQVRTPPRSKLGRKWKWAKEFNELLMI